MARGKRSGTTDTAFDDVDPMDSDANGDESTDEVEEETAPPTEEKSKPKTSKGVQEAIDKGISSPKEIVDYLKREYDIDASYNYVSSLKGKLMGGKTTGKPAGKKRGRPPGSKNKVTQPAAPAVAVLVAPPPVAAAPASASPSLTAEDLAALAEFAERAGGIDQLVKFLSSLKRLR